METKPIIVKDGQERKANPHKYLKKDAYSVFPNSVIDENNQLWYDFEQSNPPIPAYTSDGKVPEDGSYLGELVWQYKPYFSEDRAGQWTIWKGQNPPNPDAFFTRQIWLISDVVNLEKELRSGDKPFPETVNQVAEYERNFGPPPEFDELPNAVKDTSFLEKALSKRDVVKGEQPEGENEKEDEIARRKERIRGYQRQIDEYYTLIQQEEMAIEKLTNN